MPAEIDAGSGYDRRATDFRAAHDAAAQRWRRFANLRLAAFVILAAAVWWTSTRRNDAWLIPAVVALAALAGFAVLVSMSSRAKAQVVRLTDLITISEEGAHRVRREWSALEQRQWEPATQSHPYASDLDVFGPASLAQLFPALSVAPGRTTLGAWLLGAATPAEIRMRQQAVAELKTRIDFRDELVLHTRRINISAGRLLAFEEWALDRSRFSSDRWLAAAAIGIPLITLLLAIAGSLGLVASAAWLIPIAVGASLTMGFRKALRDELAQVEGQRNVLRGYASVASLIAKESFTAPLLVELRARLGAGDTGAARRMRALETLSDCADVRLSPMLHFVVQALTLWDFHVCRLLDTWKGKAGNRISGWIETLGVFESLAALATLAHDNLGWVFPEIATAEAREIKATALGHPLLSAQDAVANDVTVGPPGTLLFVTGSNMAGKSTLLRAIGLNVVLAQAGSVVCASEMICPPVSLYTSMRVQDSLERGVSYFMAELERLKLIVDAATVAHETGSRTLLYLLDEILHGTNSAERAIAARQVLLRLVSLGAIGAVTTHDLQLADTDELARIAQHVHFQEDFTRAANGKPSMHFDYRLRPGKAQSSNALKLLELVGLGVDGSPTD